MGDLLTMTAVVALIMMLVHPRFKGRGSALIDSLGNTFQHATAATIGAFSPENPAARWEQAVREGAGARFFGATDEERAALIGTPGATVNASPGTGLR